MAIFLFCQATTTLSSKFFCILLSSFSNWPLLSFDDIKEVNDDIDIVNIFRPSSEIFELVNKIIEKKIHTIWLQLEIFCTASEKKLNNLGINFIQNKCTKIEYEKIIN